ncbi:AMP-binding protein [Streptomyces sp. NPDC001276]|uniref:AMP-binding protein n=1 Tax=Streptomyces sp. NPDC001276 TaxID=3364555 RepID=UPI0036AE9080
MTTDAGIVDGHRMIHSLTFGDVIRQNRRSYPHHTAVVSDAGERLTYPELDDRVTRLANVFRASGVSGGGRVVWLGQNSHRLLECVLAAAKCGAVVCPVNWQAGADELRFIIDDVEPGIVFWQSSELERKVVTVRERHDGGARWIQHDGTDADSYDGLLADAPADDPENYVDPNEPLLLMYTGAFDGRPNGALLSQLGIMLHGLVIANRTGINDEYVYLNCGPMYRMGVLWNTLATLHLGGTNVFVPRADPELICPAVERYRCMGALIMEPTLSAVIAFNKDAKHDLSSLRSRPGNADWSAMTSLDPFHRPNDSSLYGQTEVAGLITTAAADVAGLHGRPSPVAQLRLFGEDGREVAPGEIGEIVVRGPQIMTGYLRRPELNGFRQHDGWHWTNDLGRRETDGSITFLGPKGRLIKSGIENIYPAEVEACLRRHPAVANAGVIGVPAADAGGQTVKAIVVVKPDMKTTPEELVQHGRQHLAAYKVPRVIQFAPALPVKGAAIDYESLDRDYGGGGYPGSQLFSAMTGL